MLAVRLTKIPVKHKCMGVSFVPDFAENRLKLAEILYYKILENVMVQETRRLPGRDMSVSSSHSVFHTIMSHSHTKSHFYYPTST